ncbi:dynein regulatory complex protein 9-like [Topomyia yanbarensis]|uniref:dynein regulatory complex protein 9-like n=1 Tax=Topomyia yanbarensis TaxID=2498891 RepID=UPI00273C36CE|nr:dynein regulatory complex protein 9-like [Topomyia yanbarensis]
MESIGQLELSFVCVAVEHALTKLQIINLNPTNDELLDPTGTFSIDDILNQKISLLEDFHFLTVKSISHAEEQAVSGVHRSSVRLHYSNLLLEIDSLEEELASLRRTLHDLQDKFYKRKQLEIAKNRLVNKWELARQEQQIDSLNIRSAEFREQTKQQRLAVELALDAAGRIDQYYSEQLDNVQTAISDWMDRFDREKDEVESRAQKARARKKRWDEMQAEFEQRAADIAHLERTEMQYHKDAEHRKMCQKYAVKIQAWWRGVMVRRGLGKKEKPNVGKRGKKGKKETKEKGKSVKK